MEKNTKDRLQLLYRDWSARMASNPSMSISDLRSMFDEWHMATSEPEDVTYRSDNIEGIDAIWVNPIGANINKVILYTHGGGFAVGSAASHRKLVGHLAKALNIKALIIDYRRSPEHKFPAQIDDATRSYLYLLSNGYSAKNIIFSGDSAGGNLAISTVLNLRERNIELPGGVVVFSPWLDMEHKGKTLISNANTDYLVSKEILQVMSGMYLGDDVKPDNPLANPLKANFRGFPRLYINAGSVETLLDNATELSRIAKNDGVEVTISVVENMQHVFPFLAGYSEEVGKELDAIRSWYIKN